MIQLGGRSCIIFLLSLAFKKNRRKDEKGLRNKIIRQTVGVQPIQEYVEKSQRRWYGHVNRIYDKRIVKRVNKIRETGKRVTGRPRKTWKEGLQEATRKKGVTWKETERTVKDREKWKALWDPLYTGR
jgi:hypothetical protein